MIPSLGYEVGDWITDHLPSLGNPTGEFTLTGEQARFVIAFYAVDEHGDFVYRRALLQQAKGWGKSPLAAALALAEFAGPVLLDGRDAKGRPVGRPWGTGGSPPAWVQVAASSEEQAQSNVYSLIWEFLTLNGGKAAETLGIDQGRTRLFLKDHPGSKLEAVTSDAGSREGQRVTFAVLDETHLWTPRNGGGRLARTLRRNAAKTAGRTLECANAPELGAGSVAEQTAAEFQTGRPGIFLTANRPSTEPSPEMEDAELLARLREVYGDASWIDLGRLVQEVHDPATPWEEALRFFFNVATGSASAAVAPEAWAKLAEPKDVPAGTTIALGFDGSYSRDGTALVGCTTDGYIFPLLVLERPKDAPEGWTIPRARVHETLAHAFEHYQVALVYADPYQWRSELDDWADQYGEDIVLEFPTNSRRRFGPAVERFRTAVAEGTLRHADDEVLTRHVLNARLHAAGRSADDGHQLYTLEKAGPGRLVDGAVAAVLAFEAAATVEEVPAAGIQVIDLGDDW